MFVIHSCQYPWCCNNGSVTFGRTFLKVSSHKLMESVDCMERREAKHKKYVVDNKPSQKNMSHTRSTVAKGRFLSLKKKTKRI